MQPSQVTDDCLVSRNKIRLNNAFQEQTFYRMPRIRLLCIVNTSAGDDLTTQGARLCFYQTRSASSMDQGSTKKRSAVHNFVPTVTKFCVMWEGLSLPHDTKFGNCRDKIVDRRMFFIWSLIHGSGWSRLIKAEQTPTIMAFTQFIWISRINVSLLPSHTMQDSIIIKLSIVYLQLSFFICLTYPLAIGWESVARAA